VVDARRCISYHTIENHGAIPHELREPLGPWAFGCDVCSEVCPWGEKAPDLASRFGLHPGVESGGPAHWLGLSEERFEAELVGSPLRRTKRDGLARNAALVLGNLPSEEGKTALTAAGSDASSVVREAAFWALARAHGRDGGVRARLARLVSAEPDETASAGMRRSLAELT
jgi:epoxyqueuosine reductase QueG